MKSGKLVSCKYDDTYEMMNAMVDARVGDCDRVTFPLFREQAFVSSSRPRDELRPLPPLDLLGGLL
jgi:hypothetical protein